MLEGCLSRGILRKSSYFSLFHDYILLFKILCISSCPKSCLSLDFHLPMLMAVENYLSGIFNIHGQNWSLANLPKKSHNSTSYIGEYVPYINYLTLPVKLVLQQQLYPRREEISRNVNNFIGFLKCYKNLSDKIILFVYCLFV